LTAENLASLGGTRNRQRLKIRICFLKGTKIAKFRLIFSLCGLCDFARDIRTLGCGTALFSSL
jgi:hypothetical protein